MTKIIEKIGGWRSFVGKSFLWAIGIVLISAQVYPHVLEGFYLTDKAAPEPGMKFYGLIFLGLVFVIGGVYYNKLLDKLFNKVP